MLHGLSAKLGIGFVLYAWRGAVGLFMLLIKKLPILKW
jgi:hypothetical protein